MLPARRLLASCDTDDRLIGAIIQHDLSTVRYLLESRRSRSTINQSLHCRSYQDDLNHPISLLAAACHYGSYEIVDALINCFHANINTQHLPGCQTPLHYAVLAKSERLNIVQSLLRHGAHVDAQDRHGTTALMLAVLHSSSDVVHLLVEQAGANVRIYNQYHLTALDFVKSNVSILNDLLRHGAVIFNDGNLFQWLLLNNHRRLARLLLEAGYTPSSSVVVVPQRVRSLKSLCRLEIRWQTPGSHFRSRIRSLPMSNSQLIRYLLLDDI